MDFTIAFLSSNWLKNIYKNRLAWSPNELIMNLITILPVIPGAKSA
jgi:hypothetical protein